MIYLSVKQAKEPNVTRRRARRSPAPPLQSVNEFFEERRVRTRSFCMCISTRAPRPNAPLHAPCLLRRRPRRPSDRVTDRSLGRVRQVHVSTDFAAARGFAVG